MLYTVIRITMLLFTILEYHSADDSGPYAIMVLAEQTFEVFMFAFKIFYTCYRGSQLTSEGKRTLIIIREINLKLEENMSRHGRAAIKQSLDMFTVRVNCQVKKGNMFYVVI
uniref:Uncharacterized protein n=1 Tax=Cacopsylla melanoneura TaxID=428564 RepID=A0A8D9E3S3_9HEMI